MQTSILFIRKNFNLLTPKEKTTFVSLVQLLEDNGIIYIDDVPNLYLKDLGIETLIYLEIYIRGCLF